MNKNKNDLGIDEIDVNVSKDNIDHNDSISTADNSIKTSKKGKTLDIFKKKPVIIGCGVTLVVLCLIASFFLMKDNDIVDNTTTPPEIVEPVTPTPDVTPEPEPEPILEPVDELITPDVEEKYGYVNDMLGIKFNFDSNLYIKENVEEIFNTVKAILPEGRDEFNIYSDKLSSILNVAKLTTGDSDGLYISISILPFEIEKETTTLKIDGSTEVKSESIEAINLTESELVSKYDVQIKDTLAQSNCEIITYNKSTVGNVGSESVEGSTDGSKRLKGIFTSRVYSGPVEMTTSTGTVDVLQCTIPVGKNAILITAVTDGRPLDIDKSAIFNKIISSLFVSTKGPSVEVVPSTEAK